MELLKKPNLIKSNPQRSVLMTDPNICTWTITFFSLLDFVYNDTGKDVCINQIQIRKL